MELRIVIESLEPPAGRAFIESRESWNFVGWIELLQGLERFERRNVDGSLAPGPSDSGAQRSP